MTNGGVPVRSLVIRCLAASVIASAFGTFVLCAPAQAMDPTDLRGCVEATDSITKSDGSVLVAGTSNASCEFGAGLLTLVRLQPDGSVDKGFSSGGVKVFTGLAPDVARRMLDAGNGRVLIVLGDRLMMLNDDGSPDASFGAGGFVYASGVFGNSLESAAVQDDGRIVVTSGRELARLTSAGVLDSTFAGDGVIDADLTANGFYAGDIAFDPSGNIVVGGVSGFSLAVKRFSPGGDLDVGFGPNGNGYAKAVDETPYLSPQRVFVGGDGEIRVYGTAYAQVFYFAQNRVGVFSGEGDPVVSPSRVVPGGGYAFAENSIGQNVVTWGYERGERARFTIQGNFGGELLGTEFRPTPGEAQVAGIDFSSTTDSFVAAGKAAPDDCPSCSFRPTLMAIAKVDANTLQPDRGFGTGGIVLIPPNRCLDGTGPILPGATTPWNRCRIEKPVIKAEVKIRRAGAGHPSILGSVTLSAPPRKPSFVGRKVTISLPKRLEFRRRSIGALTSAQTRSNDEVRVSTRGHTIVIEAFPRVREYDVRDPLQVEPVNESTTLDFQVRPGALKRIGRKDRRKQLRFRIRAMNFPASLTESSSNKYFAAGTASKVLRFRPQQHHERAAGASSQRVSSSSR